MTNVGIDFQKVESLRRHMLLNTADMAQLLGVSRVTYYNWVKGRPVRKGNVITVKQKLRGLLNVMTVYSWPPPNVIAMEPRQRLEKLLELLK